MSLKNLMKISLLSIITSNIVLANETKKLDEITVTANKVEENIQDIPQSITVIDKEILEEKELDTLPKIIDEIPNMNATRSKTFGTSVNFRGINSSTFTNNNPVVVYIDGVPITDKYSYEASLVNAKRIEVLRGPQGTLYGKDAIGAVINIVTNDTPESLTGFIDAQYGSDNFFKTNLNISAPLIKNRLFAGLNGQFKSTDGWITNDYKNDDEAEKSENKDLNLYFKYQPTDRLSMKLNLTKKKIEDYWIEGGAFSDTSDINQIKREDIEHVNFDMPTYEEKDIDSQSFSLNYLFDSFDFSLVSTHRDVEVDGTYDTDYSNLSNNNGLSQFNYNETKTYTHEIRFSNKENFIKWVGGLYYDDEEREQGPYGYEQYYYGDTYFANADSLTKSKTYAAFGQLMIPFAQNYELTLGGRYQKIKKEIDLTTQTKWGSMTYPDYNLDDEKTWNVFLPKVALSYKINDNLSTFVSVSKGYMPGGFNYFATDGKKKDNSFDPQESINYELGIKGLYDDFAFTASIFYMDIKDIHVYKSDGNLWQTSNAEKAHSQGIELEGTYFLTDNWELSGSLGIIQAKYDDYDTGASNFDGEKIENTPSHTASITLTYRNPNGFYGLIDLKNQGKVHFYDNTNQKFLEEDSHTVANIKIGYKTSNWDIYGYVNNLTDEDYITNYMSKTDLSIATFNDPRFIGVGVRYSF